MFLFILVHKSYFNFGCPSIGTKSDKSTPAPAPEASGGASMAVVPLSGVVGRKHLGRGHGPSGDVNSSSPPVHNSAQADLQVCRGQQLSPSAIL